MKWSKGAVAEAYCVWQDVDWLNVELGDTWIGDTKHSQTKRVDFPSIGTRRAKIALIMERARSESLLSINWPADGQRNRGAVSFISLFGLTHFDTRFSRLMCE